MIAKFRLGTGISEGEVVKANDKTVWVRLKDGNTIKRHVDKHVIELTIPEKEK